MGSPSWNSGSMMSMEIEPAGTSVGRKDIPKIFGRHEALRPAAAPDVG